MFVHMKDEGTKQDKPRITYLYFLHLNEVLAAMIMSALMMIEYSMTMVMFLMPNDMYVICGQDLRAKFRSRKKKDDG